MVQWEVELSLPSYRMGIFFGSKEHELASMHYLMCNKKEKGSSMNLDYMEMLSNSILQGETRVCDGWVGCKPCGAHG